MNSKRAKAIRRAVLMARQSGRIPRSSLFMLGRIAFWMGERRAYKIAKRRALSRPMPHPAAWFHDAVKDGRLPPDLLTRHKQ